MAGVNLLAPEVGVVRACSVMDVNRSAVYRARTRARRLVTSRPSLTARSRSALAFSDAERQRVLDTLNSECFADCSPRQTYATLLDEGMYLGSVRTMYRFLKGCDQVRERRNQLMALGQPPTRSTPSRSCWRRQPMKLGRGTSLSCAGRASGRASMQRRFRVMNNVEELQRALDFPWEKWTVFLHPEQRQWVERDYAGPARVSGFAGTGKTIVSENRLAHGTMIRRLRLDSDAAAFSVGRLDSNLETTVSTMPESPRGYCAAGYHLLGGKLGKASGDVVEHGCGNLLPQIRLIGFPSSATQQRLAGHFVPNVIRFAARPLRQLLFRDFKQAKAQGRRKHQR